MAAKKVKLLLNRNVEDLGIVGDIVKVRPGFARNYLLPQALAEAPTPSKIERLKEARAAAMAELARLRQDREGLIARMKDVAITIQRSCNDQGLLYGSVTQRDISDALMTAGYGVDVRAVRLSQSIRRVGDYHVPIQFDKDLRADITLKVEPDRAFIEEKEEMEIDDEGELVEKGRGRGRREGRGEREGFGGGGDRPRRPRRDEKEGAAAGAPAAGASATAAPEKPARAARKAAPKS